MQCPSCKAEVSASGKYCDICGTELPLICQTCGALNRRIANFCFACGVLLTGRSSEPTAPKVDQGQAASERANDSAERRQVTVLFCDLVGSTALAEALDPEDMRDVERAYQGVCSQVIAHHHGYLAKFLGDGIVAYFGYPTAHEDDAERAARAALEMIGAVRTVEARPGRHLAARVGIATGVVVIGDLLDAGEGRERSVVGDTPNLAARLQTVAEPNQVVISGTTRSLLGTLFDYEDLGSIQLKGFSTVQRAWRVLRELSAESRFGALRSSASSEFLT